MMEDDSKTGAEGNESLSGGDLLEDVVDTVAPGGSDGEPAEPSSREEESDAQKVLRLEAELAAQKDRMIRMVADMDNLRKRTRREVEMSTVNGRSDVLGELLPAIDAMDMAINAIAPEGDSKGVYEGMVMVRRQFLTAVERFGLKPLSSEGEIFDPNFHEAVSQVPSSDHPSGVIVNEVRKGYMLGERLLRASMVVVSSGNPGGKQGPSAQRDDGDEPGSERDVEE
jgi:molecular chaperone GrpE